MNRISSLKNPLIQSVRSLGNRSERVRQQMFLVEGCVMIREALSCGLKPVCAFFEEGKADEGLCALLNRAGAQIYETPRHVLEAVCLTKTPQGVCCAFRLTPPVPADHLGTRLVALDGVQDPGNVGTIWRTADAAGFCGLLLGSGSADPMGDKVQRAAMGSAFRIPYCQTNDLAGILQTLRSLDYDIVVSALDGNDVYRRAPLSEKFVLVIGNEARGVSGQVKAQATHLLKLPMRGGAESLNAAVAGGILMYELTREIHR